MKNKLYHAFDEIKAEEELKRDTCVFLQEKIRRRKTVVFKRFTAALVAAAAVFLIGAVSHHLYYTEAAFIDVDVNPSIELTLNRFNRVIGSYAYNGDGKTVLDKTDVKNKTYQDALNGLIDTMTALGYIKDTGLFTATLQTKDGKDDKQLLDALKTYIDSALQSDIKTLKQDVFLVDSNTKAHAHEQNLTPAKYLAILELQEVDPTATFEGCGDHTISSIKQQTHAHKNGGEHDDGENQGPGGDETRDEKHGAYSLSATEARDNKSHNHKTEKSEKSKDWKEHNGAHE